MSKRENLQIFWWWECPVYNLMQARHVKYLCHSLRGSVDEEKSLNSWSDFILSLMSLFSEFTVITITICIKYISTIICITFLFIHVDVLCLYYKEKYNSLLNLLFYFFFTLTTSSTHQIKVIYMVPLSHSYHLKARQGAKRYIKRFS
jgi:hypothetical protein